LWCLRSGDRGVAVFVAFARSNYDLVLGEINIFDPQTAALQTPPIVRRFMALDCV
jgi:hypothetical protein